MNEKLTPQQEMWHRMAKRMEYGSGKSEAVDVKQSNGRVLTCRVCGKYSTIMGDHNPVVGMFLRGEAGLAELIRSEPNEGECGNIDSIMRDVLSPLYRIYHEVMTDDTAVYKRIYMNDDQEMAAFKMILFLIEKIGREKYMEMLTEKANED